MRKLVLLVLLLVFCLLQCVVDGQAKAKTRKKVKSKAKINARIVGGTATTISNVPYIVSLWYDGSFICGGSLVSSRYVVTAAHCVSGKSRSSLSVKAGATHLSDAGVTSSVARMSIPRAFTFGTMTWDVAVLKLSRSLTGSNISPIALCNSNLRAGNVLRVSGWGTTSENSSGLQNQLRTVLLPIIARSKCRRQYRGRATLSRSMMCAAKLGRKDSCSGDSGGPATRNSQLCGIVSWGAGCGRLRYAGVYTNVNKVKSFIRRAMST